MKLKMKPVIAAATPREAVIIPKTPRASEIPVRNSADISAA